MSDIRDYLKNWLKDTVSNNGSNGNFDKENIKARYDSTRETVIVYPSKKEYSREKIEDSFYDEKEFEKIIDDILS